MNIVYPWNRASADNLHNCKNVQIFVCFYVCVSTKRGGGEKVGYTLSYLCLSDLISPVTVGRVVQKQRGSLFLSLPPVMSPLLSIPWLHCSLCPSIQNHWAGAEMADREKSAFQALWDVESWYQYWLLSRLWLIKMFPLCLLVVSGALYCVSGSCMRTLFLW